MEENDTKGCKAKTVLGSHLGKNWQMNCEARKKGRCCKGCPEITSCPNVCSLLQGCYDAIHQSFNFDLFSCQFFLTDTEAVFKRIGTDAERGVLS